MAVVGQFRDTDDPDHFVWLRGFPDMETRAEALGRFYHGRRGNNTPPQPTRR
jgi:hypothetical protein